MVAIACMLLLLRLIGTTEIIRINEVEGREEKKMKFDGKLRAYCVKGGMIYIYIQHIYYI